MSRRRICAVTSTRADYGLLFWVLRRIDEHPSFDLQLVVTGTHLVPDFGMTVNAIEADGFRVAERVEMLLAGDSRTSTVKSLALAVDGIGAAVHRLQPDLVLLLGDRYEILAAAQAALMLGLPLAHIAGGDTTEGAFDEAIRHSITKMSHLHFVTNVESARRVMQMGEPAARVHVVGSPGLDYLRSATLLTREELSVRLGFDFRERNLLVTFHPATNDAGSPAAQLSELLEALASLGDQYGIIFTKGNADPGSRELGTMIDNWVATHPNARAYVTLGQQGYLSAVAAVDVVVGNSSSGLYEVPSLKKSTVDIGSRQLGRLRAKSVVHCAPERESIMRAIHTAVGLDCSDVTNPYGDGGASERIVDVLSSIDDFRPLLAKSFHLTESSL